MRWAAIAYEAGNSQAVIASQWFEDLTALIDECYSRSSQGLSDSLLRAETAPGTALDKLAAFLVAALEIRRARGVFLSFRRGADLPQPSQRRLHEHDTTVRMRLKRLLNKARRDGPGGGGAAARGGAARRRAGGARARRRGRAAGGRRAGAGGGRGGAR